MNDETLYKLQELRVDRSKSPLFQSQSDCLDWADQVAPLLKFNPDLYDAFMEGYSYVSIGSLSADTLMVHLNRMIGLQNQAIIELESSAIGKAESEVSSEIRSAREPARQSISDGEADSTSSKTRVDRWLNAAKNHKFLSIVIFAAIVLGGIASVSESVRKIIAPVIPQTESSKPLLTPLDAEGFLQANRGDIERCLQALAVRYFFIDFVFTQGAGLTINVDILAGMEVHEEAKFFPGNAEIDAAHYKGHDVLRLLSNYGDRKLSVIAPDVNGCIIRSLLEGVQKYRIDDYEEGFIHRYITDHAYGD